MTSRVLIVEDDAAIATQLTRGLVRGGYQVEHVTTGQEALTCGGGGPPGRQASGPPGRQASGPPGRQASGLGPDVVLPDVVLLDLELPDGDGVTVCRTLRERSDLAIIVITAYGEETDRVSALDAGAEVDLVKPFGLAELQARIRAVLRRVRPGGGSDAVKHGPPVIDSRTRKGTVDGQEVVLTAKEFDILECLALDPGRVMSRQEVLETAWDAHWYGTTKVLDVHLAALRRKLGVPGLIETVYGRGFRLGDP